MAKRKFTTEKLPHEADDYIAGEIVSDPDQLAIETMLEALNFPLKVGGVFESVQENRPRFRIVAFRLDERKGGGIAVDYQQVGPPNTLNTDPILHLVNSLKEKKIQPIS